VLLVSKKDESWRICIDCRTINNISVKYKHSILKLDELHGTNMFSKIDVKNGYHYISIKEGDK